MNGVFPFLGPRNEQRDVFLSLIGDLSFIVFLNYGYGVVEQTLRKDSDLIAVVESVAAVPNDVPPFLKPGRRAVRGCKAESEIFAECVNGLNVFVAFGPFLL